MTAALALRPDGISTEQVDLIKRTICKGATDDELSLFVQTANRMRLDPFARQIFAVKRWSKKDNRDVMSIQVSIDGFRLTAERTGRYAGQLGPLWTSDGKEWVEVWLDSKKPPAAAKVGVMRHDFKEPIWAVATWNEYKQEGQYGLSTMWSKMGALMLAKCAESLALRRAFPNELSGAYTPEEMSQADAAPTAEYTPPAKEEAKASSPKASVSSAAMPSTAAATSMGTVSSSITPGSSSATAAAKDYVPGNKVPVAKGDAMCSVELGKEILALVAATIDETTFRETWLTPYKTHDGVQIRSVSQLTKAQADNIRRRLLAQNGRNNARHEQRTAEMTGDLEALGAPRAAATTQPRTRNLDDELQRSFNEEGEREWLHGLFGVESVKELDRGQQEMALSLILAWGTPLWDETEQKARALGRIR